ncbi:hypothetical protein OG948_24505 [Embleya sp. NBC_00888]|uniref:hypothetical protein n=1 Tax=Embleya sp. NBC_00888 TaxID=2975960 RepID=UPI00386D511E|nr:hypothetical protein OG948_24505 [Embleya sp. NBC_00888]
MTHFIAAIFGWLRRLLTPPKSAGKHARSADRKHPRPGHPTSPKPQTRPQWRDFVPPTPADDDPPMQDSATVVRPYLMTPDELAEWRRQCAEAEAAEQRGQAEARHAELAEATVRPARDWTVAARAAGVFG